MLVFYEMIYLQHPFEQLILVHFSNLVVVANSFAGYGGGAFSGTHDDICKNAQSWISRIPNYLFLARLFTTATVNYSFFFVSVRDCLPTCTNALLSSSQIRLVFFSFFGLCKIGISGDWGGRLDAREPPPP